MVLRHCLCLMVGLCCVGTVQADSWADSLFAELSKDFGSVPRGPTLSHPFHLKNNSSVPVHISGVRVSCGCVTPTVMQNLLLPGQSTAILAQMDTRRFSGNKSVTIFVSFDQPSHDEVRLWVQANSREDVSVIPEAINFGQVKRGSTPSGSVNVSFLGSGQWQILGADSDSNYVKVGVQEARRDRNETAYQVAATLRSDAPVGKWFTDIWLRTNNPATPRVRVPVNVEIESALSVSPGLVDLGQVKVGGQVERKVIVRGVRPFRITDVKGTDDELTVRPTSAESRPVQVLSVILKPTVPGQIRRPLRIMTDLADEGEIEFQAKAQIMP